MKKNRQTNKKGFTLVEMLVAVFLFTIVMLVSITAVLALIDVNKKNQSTQAVVNNLTLVVNSIVKSMAVSMGYYCGPAPATYNGAVGLNCSSSPGTYITFTTPANSAGSPISIVRYKFEPGGGGIPGKILRSVSTIPNSIADYIPITSPEIDVKSLKFYVYDTDLLSTTSNCIAGALGCNVKQPRVVMIVQGIAGTKNNTKTQFNIQTTVSQRKLDATF